MRPRQAPGGHDRGDVEVDPPQGRGHDYAEHRSAHHARADRDAAADADRDDRLPQRDDHDQPVALGEVGRHELPALGAEQVRTAHVQQQSDAPQHEPQRLRGKRRRDQQS